MKQFQRAFTLIELTIVIVVLLILAVVLPRYTSDEVNLDAQAQRLANDIRYAQSLTLSKNRRFRINFNANSYILTESDGSTAVTHPVTGGTTFTLDSGITLTSNLTAGTGATRGAILFIGKGTPYDAIANTALSSDAQITLTLNGMTKTVRVAPETGRVYIP